MKRSKAEAAKDKWLHCIRPGCGRRLSARQLERPGDEDNQFCEDCNERHRRSLINKTPASAPPSRRVG